MENNQKIKIELSLDQLYILGDLVTVEKSREELESTKACYNCDKTGALEEIENVLIDAMFL